MGMLEDALDEVARDSNKRIDEAIKITREQHAASALSPEVYKADADAADKRTMDQAKGPIVVWRYYGCEGWQPESFRSLLEAVEAGAITLMSKATIAINLSECINEP